MSPGPDRQYSLSATSRDARFDPYHRPSSTLKVEQNDTLVLPPTSTMLFTYRNHPLGVAQMNATPVPPQPERKDPILLPLLPAPAPTALNVHSAKGTFAIDPVNEDLLEDREGMPTRAEWKEIVDAYIMNLHPSKRAKALIDYDTYCKIFTVLLAPTSTANGTPQFRFWTRKMFRVIEEDEKLVVTSSGRPVAIKEHIYDIICISHTMCKHGGRDKTCKIVREHYTWIPKDLIASFVKSCPTCKPRRPSNSIFARELEPEALRTSYSVESIENFGRLPSPDIPKAEVFESSIEGNASGFVDHPHPFNSNANLSRSSGAGAYREDGCISGHHAYPTPMNTSQDFNAFAYAGHIHDCTTSGILTLPRHDSRQLPPLMHYLSHDRGRDQPDSTRFVYNNSAERSSVCPVPIDPSLYDNSTGTGAVVNCSCSQPTCDVCSSVSTQSTAYGPFARGLRLDLGSPSSLVSAHHHPTISIPTSASSSSLSYETPVDNSLMSASTAATGSELPTPSTTVQNFTSLVQHALSVHESDSTTPWQITRSSSDTQLRQGKESVPAPKLSLQTAGLVRDTPPIFSPRPLKAGDPVDALMRALDMQRQSDGQCRDSGSGDQDDL